MMRCTPLFLLLGGCVHTVTTYMKPVEPPAALQAPADQGLVVFVQPSEWAGAFAQALIDEGGHFLGRPQASTHFAVLMPAGQHLFTVWAENTDAISIDVAPGKTYFVEVGAQPGWLGPTFHLYGITPRAPTWGKREGWLQKTRQVTRDLAAGDWVAEHSGEVAERLRRGREHLEKYRGTAEEARHFIAANEGL